ncbi:hypothetical protein OIU84_024569 [Salix udensis]|uniref:Uncharacterized protein n=1 Tax=Salix udensis TaxID=889485 RepID=A0AAD6KHJ8_9ROSI|nr:hypothetical protein OIU84_024569 [Salix udensis]
MRAWTLELLLRARRRRKIRRGWRHHWIRYQEREGGGPYGRGCIESSPSFSLDGTIEGTAFPQLSEVGHVLRGSSEVKKVKQESHQTLFSDI